MSEESPTAAPHRKQNGNKPAKRSGCLKKIVKGLFVMFAGLLVIGLIGDYISTKTDPEYAQQKLEREIARKKEREENEEKKRIEKENKAALAKAEAERKAAEKERKAALAREEAERKAAAAQAEKERQEALAREKAEREAAEAKAEEEKEAALLAEKEKIQRIIDQRLQEIKEMEDDFIARARNAYPIAEKLAAESPAKTPARDLFLKELESLPVKSASDKEAKNTLQAVFEELYPLIRSDLGESFTFQKCTNSAMTEVYDKQIYVLTGMVGKTNLNPEIRERACYLIGRCYRELGVFANRVTNAHWGVERKKQVHSMNSKAAEWLIKAGDRGVGFALVEAANDSGNPALKETVGELKENVAKRGGAEAILCNFVYNPKIYEDTILWDIMLAKAEAGDALMQSQLASQLSLLIFSGHNYSVDKMLTGSFPEAVAMEKLKSHGDKFAFKKSVSVSRTKEELDRLLEEKIYTKWRRLAALNGNASTQVQLAKDLKDKKEAAEWLSKAAEQGYPEALYRLGVCYYNGDGVKQDRKKALELLHRATGELNSDAKKFLKEKYDIPKKYKGDEVLEFFGGYHHLISEQFGEDHYLICDGSTFYSYEKNDTQDINKAIGAIYFKNAINERATIFEVGSPNKDSKYCAVRQGTGDDQPWRIVRDMTDFEAVNVILQSNYAKVHLYRHFASGVIWAKVM